MPTRGRLLALPAAVTLLLAGCGQVVDGTGTPPSSTDTESTSTSADVPTDDPTPTDTGTGTPVDSDYFTVTLPDGWGPQDSSSPGVFAFYSGPTAGDFPVSVNVVREDVGTLGVTEYQARTVSQLQATLPIEDLSSTQPRFVDGDDALAYTYRYYTGSRTVRQRQVVAVHDGFGYVFTYTSTPDAFDEYSGDADRIIDSLRWA